MYFCAILSRVCHSKFPAFSYPSAPSPVARRIRVAYHFVASLTSYETLPRKKRIRKSLVFYTLRTLPSSVSRKSCICHSYENCRVCTNNSHSGTEHPIRMRVLSERSEPKDLSPSFASCATPATHQCTQVLSFQILAHSFALSCTLRKLNPLIFKRFRTLCKKTPGGGVVLVSPANYQLSTINYEPPTAFDLLSGGAILES